MTNRLSEEQRWEKGRFVEFLHPERGLRFGRIQRTFSRGLKKNMVVIALTNPYTGHYGNRGGYRKYTVMVEKKRVVRFYGKTIKSKT